MTGRRPHSRHGLNAVKARVALRGLHAIDQRTVAARGLLAWRAELVEALGGDATVTPQQRRALIEMATRARLYLDHVDHWLMGQPTLVHARRRALLPILRERQTLADGLLRVLSALGLERRQTRAPDLTTYIASRYGRPGAPADGAPRLQDRSEPARATDRMGWNRRPAP